MSRIISYHVPPQLYDINLSINTTTRYIHVVTATLVEAWLRQYYLFPKLVFPCFSMKDSYKSVLLFTTNGQECGNMCWLGKSLYLSELFSVQHVYLIQI